MKSQFYRWYGNRSRVQKNIIYLLVFSLLFCIFWIGTNIVLLHTGKSLIVRDDSVANYYEMLMYRKAILREVLTNILKHHRFSIPWVNYNLTGDDNLFRFIGNELSDVVLCFVPQKNFEGAYNIAIIWRIWLAGLTFSLYGIKMGNRRCYTLLGSLVYAFSGYPMNMAYYQPFFISMLYMAPLLFLGVEEILEKKRGMLLTGAVLISSLISIFLAYYNTIVLVLYCIFRLWRKGASFKQTLQMFLRIGICYLVALGLSGFMTIPMAIAVFQSGRIESGAGLVSYWYYSRAYVLEFIKDFFIVKPPGSYDGFLGFSVLAFYPIALLFIRRNCNKALKYSLLLVLILMNIPLWGLIAGASTVNNRWSYYLGFLVAYAVTALTPTLMFGLQKKERQLLNLSIAAYMLLLLLFYVKYREYTLLTTFLLLGCTAACMNFIWHGHNKETALFYLFGVAFLYSVTSGYTLQSGKYIERFIDRGHTNQEIAQYVDAAARDIDDADFYRIEKYGFEDELSCNLPFWYGYNGISSFANIVNPAAFSYYQELECTGLIQINKSSDLGGRITDEALACVKYYLSPKDESAGIPYGFSYSQTYSSNPEYAIYVNTNTLPLGYTYTDTISKDAFDRLSIAEKQEIMLRSIILDNTNASDTTHMVDDLKSSKLNANITEMHNVEETEGGFHVIKKDAFITLSIPAQSEEGELFVQLTGVLREGSGKFYITTSNKSTTRSVYCHSTESVRSNGQNNFTVSLGQIHNESQEITISFSTSNIYIREIFFYSRDLSGYETDIANLKKEGLENITFATNRIDGDITVSQDKYLCFSLPYSKGWTCYVDGQKTELLQANIMYMAVPLETGEHHICLTYLPYGFRVGMGISVFCALICMAHIIRYIYR